MPIPKHDSCKEDKSDLKVKLEPLRHDLNNSVSDTMGTSADDKTDPVPGNSSKLSSSSNSKQQRSSSKENKKLVADHSLVDSSQQLTTGYVTKGQSSETHDLTRTRSPSAKKGMPLSGASIATNGESKRKEIVDESYQPNPGEASECSAQTSKGRKSSRKGSKKKDKVKGGVGGSATSVEEEEGTSNGLAVSKKGGGGGGPGSSDIQPEESTTNSNQVNSSTIVESKTGAHGDRNSNKSCCFCWCCCCSCSW